MVLKDFNGNVLKRGDDVLFASQNGKGNLLSGKIDCLRKDNIGIISKRPTGNVTYWRKEGDIAKIVYKEKVYITPYMFPMGQEPDATIHEDEKGTYYLKEDLDWQSKNFLQEAEESKIVEGLKKHKSKPTRRLRSIRFSDMKGIERIRAGKRIQNIIDAIPGVKWDPSTIKITNMGWGDRAGFTMIGHIRKPIKGKIAVVTWYSNTPGGGISRLQYWYKGKSKKIKANLANGAKRLDEVIKLLEEECQ